MKLLITVLVLCCATLKSQNDSLNSNTAQDKMVYTIVEEMPEPEGGMNAFYKHVSKTIQYPKSAAEAGIGGKVYVVFVVTADGKLRDPEVRKGIPGCPDCDKEAMRVVQSYPAWKAGRQNGRAVDVYLMLAINFKMM